ncbi:MAG: class C sortase [Acutalibacter sp.]
MKKQASKKNRMTLILLLAVLLAGLSLLLYPMVADYWNSMHQSQAIASYQETVAEMDDETYEALWQAAEDYNSGLLGNADRFQPTQEEHQRYEELLDVSGSGVMGYVEIPGIDVSLPIYHGTSEEVLQVAVGHIEGSSLPVGGESTHCVISGHRGLPSARLFTDLDQLSEGDIFTLRVLDETLTYEVDQIHVVEPDDITQLEIVEGEDLCTLVTCTLRGQLPPAAGAGPPGGEPGGRGDAHHSGRHADRPAVRGPGDWGAHFAGGPSGDDSAAAAAEKTKGVIP